MGDLSNEPSMEDILSSIKRIIAEDSEATLAPPRGSKRAVAPTPPVPETIEDEEVLELTETVEAEPAPTRAAPAPVVPHQSATLVSEATAEASRSQLAALSALIVKPEVTGSDTLEGMVRDMIKPMIGEWLEARLPEIVERMVAREIARITERDA